MMIDDYGRNEGDLESQVVFTDERPEDKEEYKPVKPATTSQWTTDLQKLLREEFYFSHITTSVYASVAELSRTQDLLCKRIDRAVRQGQNVLLFVYYRGNGGVDMRCKDTYALL